MHTRKIVMTVAVLVLGTGLLTAPAVAGEPPIALPDSPTGLAAPVPLPEGLDPVSPYQPQVSCSPTDMAGPTRLRDLVLSTYGAGRSGGISRGCTEGLSEHSEGRAWDWMVDPGDARQTAAAADFLAWVTRDDGANARRLGIMYVIHNKKIWSLYNVRGGWRPSSGHTDHVHVSFSWNGARANTSFWTGAVGAVDTGPCRRFNGSYAVPTGTPRAQSCPASASTLVRTSRGKRAFGSTGGTVRRAQERLKISRTGRFDSSTLTAVRRYQRAHDLPATGTLDHPTWASLDKGSITRRSVTGYHRTKAANEGIARYGDSRLSQGRAGRGVLILQYALGMSRVDRNGYFGAVTRAKVVALQERAGLTPDGAVGGEEWRAIRAAIR